MADIKNMTDIKKDFVIEHLEGAQIQDAAQGIRYVEGSEEEKRLLRKIDYRLIPTVWIMYVMSYLDRANIGNAKTGGMGKDLLYLPIIMAMWGAVSMCLAACTSYGSLSIVRLILGFVEAGFSPGVLFLLSCWYRKNELARRWALFYTGSAVSGALGGILAGAITGNLDGKGGIAGWKYLFLIEGAATILTAIGAWFLLPDYPSNTKWLTPEERMLAEIRLRADGVDAAQSGEQKGHWDSFKNATSDWRTWVMTFMYMMNTGAQTIQ
ncbi:hypothetical protein QFC21_003482 [Naganishia friedmannii]|uniref:Uncharacterized protein n=1 Tax=Naganishia friedmannii TaxID=89922 RepID=A0ACC2VQ18_9TREE|nr:hypothetical protein QFC21_003482 [Naganishia friedmannii]